VDGEGVSCRTRRLIVAITAVQGAGYAIRLLEVLHARGVETHLVVSEDARAGVEAEAATVGGSVTDLADHVHHPSNQAARISSGSFLVNGMVVAPCTVAAAGAIAHGVGVDLIHRAADVTMKEGRHLALLMVDDAFSPVTRENLDKLAAISCVSVVRPVASTTGAGGVADEGALDATVELLLRNVGLEREG
jgi:flavin prenyltransferase